MVGEGQVQQHPDVGISQSVEGPSSTSANRHDPVRAKQAKSVRHPGLALAAGRRQIADTHLPVEQGCQEPQPAGVGKQPERCSQVIDQVGVRESGPDGRHPLDVVFVVHIAARGADT